MNPTGNRTRASQLIRALDKSLVFLVPIGILALPMFLSRCGKQSGTFSDVYTNVIQSANCSQCHVTGGSSQNTAQQDYSSQSAAYTSLTTKTVTGTGSGTAGCSGRSIVSAGAPASSYVAQLLVSSYNTASGGCTPLNTHLSGGLGVVNLSESQRTSLVTWIQNGAKND
jgi:hypothetical protein